MSDVDDENKDELPLPPPPPGLPIPPPISAPIEGDSSENDLPAPPPPPGVDIPSETSLDSEPSETLEPDESGDFQSAWQKRKRENPALSADKRDQMYGHIDRIATGEVGTLLDRFSDRFGSELDREIIVLRKKQQKEMRDIKPTVELISAPESDEEAIPQAKPVAKAKAVAKSTPDTEDTSENQESIEEDIPSQDLFPEFFSIVNDLLGNMPDEFVNSFIQSEDFALFQKVGENPDTVDESTRKEFFGMINRVLGDLPDDKINEFVQSEGFSLFQQMGQVYSD